MEAHHIYSEIEREPQEDGGKQRETGDLVYTKAGTWM